MELTSRGYLKAQFKEAFPEYACRMEQASNQQEAERIYNQIVGECYLKMKKNFSNGMLRDGSEGIVVYIKEKDCKKLIEAKGNDIEYNVSKILNSFCSVKKAMDEGDHEAAVGALLAGGVIAVGSEAIGLCIIGLKAGATTYAAALKAITTCWGGVVSLVAFVVTLILIPIFYFMEKPANTIMLLLNETKETVELVDQHVAHGKQMTLAKEINGNEDGQPGYNAGAFVCSKRDDALIGTATGYHFRLKDSNKDFYIGVECPLTSIYGDNNCYCSATGSAKEIVEQTSSKNKQSAEATNGNFKCSVKCNDKGGSVAYYVARIYE